MGSIERWFDDKLLDILPETTVTNAVFLADLAAFGAVYLISMKETNHYKIGWSKFPFNRLSGLQTGNPFSLTMVSVCPGGLDCESLLHRHLRYPSKRSPGVRYIRGEWYYDEGSSIEDFFQDLAQAYLARGGFRK